MSRSSRERKLRRKKARAEAELKASQAAIDRVDGEIDSLYFEL